MKSKTVLFLTAILVIGILVTGAFAVGFVSGGFLLSGQASSIGTKLFPDSVASSGDVDLDENTDAPQDLDELFKPFWQAWEVVHEDFVEQPVDDTLLMRGAISGMLEALGDEHTSYLDPVMMERFNISLNGEEYEGIGAWVDTGGDYLTVISAMPESPAEKAGLKTGDEIIAIDGEDMTGVDPELARQRVLGPKSSTVVLTIRREGVEEPFDVSIKRASIQVPTIISSMVEDENILYIQLYTFGAQTDKDLRDALKTQLKENPDGLILDLRNNGGGYLDTAISIVSEFIGEGVVMLEEHADGSIETFEARKGGLATDIPMVVLVNQGSASASEIVAGAIQDHDRGYLVGITSFGKGSVQNVTRLVDDQGQIRVTIARWLTPDGRQINGEGLEPDFIIEITDEDFASGLDPQYDKAIELLKELIGQ
jgi:carboxyl-terminal processing protease